MNDSSEKLNERISSLEKELSSLRQKMSTLEEQLHEIKPTLEGSITKSPHDQSIEKEIGLQQTSMAQTNGEKLQQQKKQDLNLQKEVPPSNIHGQKKPVEKTKKTPNHDELFERLLGVWLPRIFMVVLILGVLWGLKVGIDNGWISYEARIILGYVSTLLIFYFGMKNINKGQKLFGLTLISGVIAIGILVTVAAYYLYELFNYPIAMMISFVYIALGFIMSKKTNSESLTIFSGMAGFLLPFLIQGTTVNTWTFCLYLLILFLTLFYIAISGKHKVSYYVIFFFFQLTLLFYTILALLPGDEMYIVLTALIQHLIFLLFYVNHAISRSIFTETTIYLNVIFMVGWVKLLEAQQDVPVYAVLAMLYILFSIYGFSRKDIKLQSIFSAVSIFAISVFILSFNVETYESKMLLLLINGAIGIWVGFYFKSIRTMLISGFIYIMTGLSVLAVVSISSWLTIQNATWIVFIATLIFICATLYALATKNYHIKTKSIDFSLIVPQLVSLIYVFKLTIMILDTKVKIVDWSLNDHITFLILLVAIIISFFAYKWRSGIYVAYVAVIEFLFIGLIFLTSPLTSYGTSKQIFLFNVFSEMFYLLVFTLLVVIITRGKFPGTNKLQKFSSIFGVISQFVYFVFFNKWYFGFVDIFVWEYDYVYIGHTIWMFLFAFLSISFGARLGWKVVRYLGIILIGVCLLKLFFIDLINVSIVIRAILFIVVGVIGLVYSRMMLRSSGKDK